MLTLRECQGVFAQRTQGNSWRKTDSILDANGVWFLCPLCFLANHRQRPGVHGVLCWNETVPADVVPGPGRWSLRGSSLDNLTLVGSQNSIHLQGGCGWHGFVTGGALKNERGEDL